jgi:hypothetical protein
MIVSDAPDELRGAADTHPHAIRVTDLIVE